MTYEEYLEKKSAIEKEKDSLIHQLAKEYALNNNSYKIGDTISDRFGVTILIDKIVVGFNFGKPYCIYSGTKLRKDGTPYKSGVRESVHQNHVLKNETKS
jgi:hypothetical protein